jgi:hypothetical protein
MESWTPGVGPIDVNRFKSGLLDIVSFRFIYCTNWDLRFADSAGTTIQMVHTDDGGHNPAIYREYVEVFQEEVETLPPH